MKKVLLTGAAFVALATSPAMAEGLSLDLAGHFKGYGVYNDNDEAAATVGTLDKYNIRKETEVHFTGETTLDSGLTVGVHVELDVDRDDANSVDESYMYLSGGWGRVNFGEEDGAAYLLQVAAPSADSNIDGLRQYISTYNGTGTVGAAVARIDYDHVAPGSSKYNKLTYMTPVFNGFQAGVSYIPTMSNDGNGLTATNTVNTAADFEDGYEAAVRYEGAFSGVGVAVGAGAGYYNAENTNATAAGNTDDTETYNVGLDLDFAGFGLGAAYLVTDAEAASANNDSETLVVGADYQMGAYKLGASWLNQHNDVPVGNDLTRWTAGASYSYGPGMSFRGSVSVIDADNSIDSTQVTLGTQVNF